MNTLPQNAAVQITDIVRTLAMPLPVKEMILDQVLGFHDDLHKPARKRQERTPMAVRVAKAREVGAFKFLHTEPDGTDVYLYHKNGQPAYRFKARDGQPVSCECRNFQEQHWHDPDYICKHGLLWIEMENMPTEDEYAALVEDAAEAAAEFIRVWLAWRHGRATSAECDEAGRRQEETRQAADAARPDMLGTWADVWAREAAETKATDKAQEGRAA